MPMTDSSVPTMPSAHTSPLRLMALLNSALIMVAKPRLDEYRLMSFSFTVEATTMMTPMMPDVPIMMSTIFSVPMACASSTASRFMPSSPTNVPMSVIQNTWVPFFRNRA